MRADRTPVATRATAIAARARPATLALLLTGCSVEQNVLDPQGATGERIAGIGWFMIWASSAIIAVYVAILLVAVVRRRRDPESRPRMSEQAWVVAGGVVLPVVVIVALTVLSLGALAEDREGEVRVEVTGHQYWWEVHYPEEGFTTANELRIPVGRPVEFTIYSDDVIHSWWLPDLGPKVDMVPGHENHVVLQADRPGVYRGVCAEYCGIQHAHMVFLVTAVEEDEYEDWLDAMGRPAVDPGTDEEQAGLDAFLELPCAACHTIRGTPADGTLGPDLTHLASRETLGAGTVPNTRGHLGGWIVNSQTVKPGNLMPPIAMSPEQLKALLAYLGSLE